MKFVTLADGTRDGRLHMVSRNGHRVEAVSQVRTLQEALESWEQHAPDWQIQYERLNSATDAEEFRPEMALAPLPRAWQWLDGSAFETHALLLQKAWGYPEVGLSDRPLMYQGLSDRFQPPVSEAVFPSPEDGIDFEGEFGVILGEVPMGTPASDAGRYIRLVVLINDWSLRGLGPLEMATGFGWLQCKPACSIAPFAVSVDELGEAWRNHRVCLPLGVNLNGARFGRANGEEMKFGFNELIAHAAYSRDLPAGTILGSGTIANVDYRTKGSSCIAERRAIEQIAEMQQTPFLGSGDRVEMFVQTPDGSDLFGRIDQKVVVANHQ